MRTQIRRLTITTLIVIILLLGAGAATASATAAAQSAAPAYHAQQGDQPSPARQGNVPSHEGTRVSVQLVVLGLAIGVVVIIGSAAYLLRKKLGLVAPPPDQTSAGRH